MKKSDRLAIAKISLFLFFTIPLVISCTKHTLDRNHEYVNISARESDASNIKDVNLRSIAAMVDKRIQLRDKTSLRFSSLGTPMWDKAVIVAQKTTPEYIIPLTEDNRSISAVLICQQFEGRFKYKLIDGNLLRSSSGNISSEQRKQLAVLVYMNNHVFNVREFSFPATALNTQVKHNSNVNVKFSMRDVGNSSSTVSGRWDYVEICFDSNAGCTCPSDWSSCDWCNECVSTTCFGDWVYSDDEYLDPADTGGGGGGSGGYDPYYHPVSFNGVWYTTNDYPGLTYGFPWKWWESNLFLQPYGGLSFGSWAMNYLSLDPTFPFSTFYNWFFSTPEYTGGEELIDPDFITYDEPFFQVPLPSLNSFETNFPKNGSSGSYTQMSSPDVYQLVGGSPYSNHLAGNPSYQNACALRGSRALLYSGIHIPVLRYNGLQRTEKGGDNKNYILDAVSFDKFMKDKFGDTPHKLEGADANDPQKVADLLKNKNGIYVIVNNNPGQTGTGYSGHVDFIQNGNCVGGAYTTPPGGVKSIRIWVLN
jgi:hypothetical protein